jgi:hypothetical protein
VEKNAYNAATLERVLHTFEESYGFTSAEFYKAHVENGELVADMSGSNRQVWASFYTEWRRFGDSAFAARRKPLAIGVCAGVRW